MRSKPQIDSAAKLTVTEYMDYSTAHGIGRVKNTPYVALKVLWVSALLGSITMFAVQLSRLTDKWRQFSINTKLELETLKEMRFPAVTVCNMNPLRYSQVQDNYDLMTAVQVAASKWGVSLNAFEDDAFYNGTNHNVTAEVNRLEDVTGSGVTIETMAEYFRIKASSVDNGLIANYSHQIKDLLVSCSFSGAECTPGMFVEYRSYDYGMCYTFGMHETNQSVDDLYKVYSPGRDYGLTLILNAEQDEYIPFVTDSAGFIVTVHIPDETPYEREEGIRVSAGFSTEIAVVMEVEDRLPGPRKRCEKNNEVDSLKSCHRKCLEKSIIDRCGCTRELNEFINKNQAKMKENDIEYDNKYDDMYSYDPDLRMCNPQNDTFCILESKAAQGLGEFRCPHCIAHCRTTQYMTYTSVTKWPAQTYRPVLEKIFEKYSTTTYSESDVSDNMAQVRVYLPSFTKHTLKEEQAYTDENFVSDIGGQLGLWIGFSVLSLCELVELIILLVSSCFRRKITPSDAQLEALPANQKQ